MSPADATCGIFLSRNATETLIEEVPRPLNPGLRRPQAGPRTGIFCPQESPARPGPARPTPGGSAAGSRSGRKTSHDSDVQSPGRPVLTLRPQWQLVAEVVLGVGGWESTVVSDLPNSRAPGRWGGTGGGGPEDWFTGGGRPQSGHGPSTSVRLSIPHYRFSDLLFKNNFTSVL